MLIPERMRTAFRMDPNTIERSDAVRCGNPKALASSPQVRMWEVSAAPIHSRENAVHGRFVQKAGPPGCETRHARINQDRCRSAITRDWPAWIYQRSLVHSTCPRTDPLAGRINYG